MNQRKAKRLRRIAEARTEGMPNVSYEVGQAPIYDAIKDDEGKYIKPYKFQKIERGVPRKMGYCTRKLYKDMKKLNG